MTYQESAYQQVNIVDRDGNIITSFGGGGSSGGGGDASAAKQDQQTALLQSIQAEIGNADITGTVLPSGGQGMRGWLSAIWKLLGDRLPSLTNSGRIPVDVPSGLSVSITNTEIEVTNDADHPVIINAPSLPLPQGAASDATLGQVRDRIPIALGTNTAANSFPVVLASDGTFAQAVGTKSDVSATSSTGTFSLLALTKRLSTRLDQLLGQNGATYTNNTNAVTGNYLQILVVADAVFTSLTMTGLDGNSIIGDTIPTGTALCGNITGYQLASGKVFAYKA